MFNFLQDLVVVANCLPYIACLWTPLPPTVNESSAIKDIKQKLPSSQYVRPSFQKIISYPSLAFRQETSMNLSVFQEQGDLGYHICWKAPSIWIPHLHFFFNKHSVQPVECFFRLQDQCLSFWVIISQMPLMKQLRSLVHTRWKSMHCPIPLKAVWTPKGWFEAERKTGLSKWGTPHIPLKYIGPFK